MNQPSDNVLVIVSIIAFGVGYFAISKAFDWFSRMNDPSNRPGNLSQKDTEVEVLDPGDSRHRELEEKFRREQEKRNAEWDKYKRPDRQQDRLD